MAGSYDLIIIGSGTAAMVASNRASAAGRKVAVTDFPPFGGTSALASQPTAIIKGADDPAFTGEIPLIGDEALGARDYRVEDGYSASGGKARSRMSGKRIGILAAVIALLLLAAFAITYSAQFWGGRTVPDVVGRTTASAAFGAS